MRRFWNQGRIFWEFLKTLSPWSWLRTQTVPKDTKSRQDEFEGLLYHGQSLLRFQHSMWSWWTISTIVSTGTILTVPVWGFRVRSEDLVDDNVSTITEVARPLRELLTDKEWTEKEPQGNGALNPLRYLIPGLLLYQLSVDEINFRKERRPTPGKKVLVRTNGSKSEYFKKMTSEKFKWLRRPGWGSEDLHK